MSDVETLEHDGGDGDGDGVRNRAAELVDALDEPLRVAIERAIQYRMSQPLGSASSRFLQSALSDAGCPDSPMLVLLVDPHFTLVEEYGLAGSEAGQWLIGVRDSNRAFLTQVFE